MASAHSSLACGGARSRGSARRRAGACLGRLGSPAAEIRGDGEGRGRAPAGVRQPLRRRPEGLAAGAGPGGSRSAERGDLLSDREHIPDRKRQEFVRMTGNH